MLVCAFHSTQSLKMRNTVRNERESGGREKAGVYEKGKWRAKKNVLSVGKTVLGGGGGGVGS